MIMAFDGHRACCWDCVCTCWSNWCLWRISKTLPMSWEMVRTKLVTFEKWCLRATGSGVFLLQTERQGCQSNGNCSYTKCWLCLLVAPSKDVRKERRQKGSDVWKRRAMCRRTRFGAVQLHNMANVSMPIGNTLTLQAAFTNTEQCNVILLMKNKRHRDSIKIDNAKWLMVLVN